MLVQRLIQCFLLIPATFPYQRSYYMETLGKSVQRLIQCFLLIPATFLYQRSYYMETLAKSPIYEYSIRSPYVHVDDIFTNIQLMNNEDEHEVGKRKR